MSTAAPATRAGNYRDTRARLRALLGATATVLLLHSPPAPATAAVLLPHSSPAPADEPAIAMNAALSRAALSGGSLSPQLGEPSPASTESVNAEAAGPEPDSAESTRAGSAPPIEEISPATLSERRAREPQSLTVLDVRSTEEFAAGHLPGATNIPLDQLPARLVELSANDEIVVYCQSGVRSAQAINLLRGRAYTRVEHLTGDFLQWQSGGGAVEISAP